MAEIIFKKNKQRYKDRDKIYNYYLNKYLKLFMEKYDFEGLDYQQRDFFLREMFTKGSILAFLLSNSKGVEYPQGMLLLTPYAPFQFNMYNFPIYAQPTRLRNAPFVPSTRLKVDEECVIIYAQSVKSSIISSINYLLEKIVACEMLINISEDTTKLPFLIACSQEDKAHMQSILESILEGKSEVYCDFSDIQNIKVLNNGNNYILDKLMQYKNERENELKSYLGINNFNTQEKSQYINIDTTNSNNDEIDISSDSFLTSMQEGFDRLYDILGYQVIIKDKHPEEMAEDEEEDEEDGE